MMPQVDEVQTPRSAFDTALRDLIIEALKQGASDYADAAAEILVSLTSALGKTISLSCGGDATLIAELLPQCLDSITEVSAAAAEAYRKTVAEDCA